MIVHPTNVARTRGGARWTGAVGAMTLFVVGSAAFGGAIGCESRVVDRSGLGSDQVIPTTHERHSDDTFSEWFTGEPESDRR